MKHKIKYVLISAVLAGMAATALAQSNLYVATNGVDNTDAGRGQSWALPYLTISNGVAHAPTAGDTVWASNGTYNITAVISIMNGITVQSTNGPAATIVNGSGAGRCFILDNTNAVLSGFTITNGYYTADGDGGGILCSRGLVTNCVISGNEMARSGKHGGGIYIGGTGTVDNCIISNNTAYWGGGAALVGNGTMKNCLVVDNVATSGLAGDVYRSGGGVWMQGGTATNCTITGNTATNGGGGGVGCDWGGTLWNCTISSNTAKTGGGVGFYYAGTLLNSTVRDNTTSADSVEGGGGIFLGWGGTVSNCVITGNVSYAVAGNGAGGIRFMGSGGNAVVRNSTIVGNQAAGAGTSRGGGVYFQAGGTMRECVIKDNRSNDRGAGVRMWTGGRLINCLITGNYNSDYGGGIVAARLADNSGYISSCTIVSNKAWRLGGMLFDDLTTASPITNCIVYLNKADGGNDNVATGEASTNYFWYSCVAEQMAVNQGNIQNNPQFVDTNTNYRLTKESPCVNAGTNQDWMTGAADLDGYRRIDKFIGRVDMGAYEFIYSGSFYTVH